MLIFQGVSKVPINRNECIWIECDFLGDSFVHSRSLNSMEIEGSELRHHSCYPTSVKPRGYLSRIEQIRFVRCCCCCCCCCCRCCCCCCCCCCSRCCCRLYHPQIRLKDLKTRGQTLWHGVTTSSLCKKEWLHESKHPTIGLMIISYYDGSCRSETLVFIHMVNSLWVATWKRMKEAHHRFLHGLPFAPHSNFQSIPKEQQLSVMKHDRTKNSNKFGFTIWSKILQKSVHQNIKYQLPSQTLRNTHSPCWEPLLLRDKYAHVTR